MVIRTNVRTAEMIKYASNALFATLISFSNEIGNFCAAEPGVDAVDVMSALHLRPANHHRRRGRQPRRSRPHELLEGRLWIWRKLFPKGRAGAHRVGFATATARRVLLSAVLETNEKQPAEVLGLLKKHFPDLHGLRVAVLGLAFKPGTDDLRESPALRVIARLLAEGAKVIAYDPDRCRSRPRDDRFGECELRDVTGGSDGERRCRAAADRVAGVRSSCPHC